MGAAHRPAVCLRVEMGLVSAEVDTGSAAVLAQVVGRDKPLDNLVVLRLLVAAVVLAAVVALVAELDLPSSRSSNQHY